MTAAPQKTLRPGQAHKRAAILAAARDLFVHVGVERTSMDAVAAKAAVSKRTVYDYYGDKRRLLLAVIEEAGEAALDTLRRLLDEHLPEGVGSGASDDLERAVIAFASALGSSLLASADYAAAVTLISENEPLLPELEDHPLDAAHTQAVAVRLAAFADSGLLDVDDPQRAADHLTALTTLRVLNEPLRRRSDPDRVRDIMIDGARVFLRAYAPRPERRS